MDREPRVRTAVRFVGPAVEKDVDLRVGVNALFDPPKEDEQLVGPLPTGARRRSGRLVRPVERFEQSEGRPFVRGGPIASRDTGAHLGRANGLTDADGRRFGSAERDGHHGGGPEEDADDLEGKATGEPRAHRLLAVAREPLGLPDPVDQHVIHPEGACEGARRPSAAVRRGFLSRRAHDPFHQRGRDPVPRANARRVAENAVGAVDLEASAPPGDGLGVDSCPDPDLPV